VELYRPIGSKGKSKTQKRAQLFIINIICNAISKFITDFNPEKSSLKRDYSLEHPKKLKYSSL
jgi:hypothetical protein